MNPEFDLEFNIELTKFIEEQFNTQKLIEILVKRDPVHYKIREDGFYFVGVKGKFKIKNLSREFS